MNKELDELKERKEKYGHKCQHRCDCKHERVKYCPTCRVVHCLDCKQEWTSFSHTYAYPNSAPWTYLTATAPSSKGTLDVQWSQTSGSAPSPCPHT